MRSQNKGFTILELLVVVAILAVLAVIALPNFIGRIEQARAARDLSDTRQLESACNQYYIDNGDWPRLTDTPFTKAQVESFTTVVVDSSGKTVSIDSTGKYYELDYAKLEPYIRKPANSRQYVLQNPVGKMFYLKELTAVGKTTLYAAPALPQTPVSYTADIIPTMTSNTSPSGVAAASSVYSSSYEAFKAFDGITGTLWNTPAQVKTGWLTYEFPTAKKVCKYSIRTTHSTTDIGSSLKTWTLQGSDDGVNWTVLDTRTNEPYWAITEKREYTFTNNTAYKKYKLDVTANHSGAYVVIAELEMYEGVY